MTSGSAPPAGDRPDTSSTTPTDGPPSEPNTTEAAFPISPEEFSSTLSEAFKAGWKLARLLTQEEPPDVEFRPIVDAENRSVTVESIVHQI